MQARRLDAIQFPARFFESGRLFEVSDAREIVSEPNEDTKFAQQAT
jgi:hypothetical protein